MGIGKVFLGIGVVSVTLIVGFVAGAGSPSSGTKLADKLSILEFNQLTQNYIDSMVTEGHAMNRSNFASTMSSLAERGTKLEGVADFMGTTVFLLARQAPIIERYKIDLEATVNAIKGSSGVAPTFDSRAINSLLEDMKELMDSSSK
jgi:hypothetical protein